MGAIKTITSISHQNSFDQKLSIDALCEIDDNSTTIAPNYKDFIAPAAMRRLSPVLKMAITTAKYCQSSIDQPFDAISVGTALGCLRDTERFLTTFHTATGDTLSPTAFIQSTHNTIGGQVSLALSNHAYNMTHTQNSVSFEIALIDAMMLVEKGHTNVLVGAADEAIEFLNELAPKIITKRYPFSSGATFAVLQSNENKGVKVKDCKVYFESSDLKSKIENLLKANKLSLQDIDLVLTSDDSKIEGPERVINYQKYSGLYYTSSAFAFHLAHDTIESKQASKVLIVNTQCEPRIGLTLLTKDEA